MAKSVVLLTAIILTGGALGGDDCLVENKLRMEAFDQADFLAYIRPSSPLYMTAIFKGRSFIHSRDDIAVNNTEAIQYLVRDYDHWRVRHPTTLILPEGWVALTLKALNRDLVIMHRNISILSMPLEFDLRAVELMGTLSRCKTMGPVWELSEGEVEVPLQPVMSSSEVQEVRVTAPTHTTAYITFPHSKTTTNITTNATLHIALTSSNDEAIIDVNQISART